MPKRAAPASRPHITLDSASPVPLYRQLYERLRAAILAGQLEGGARLPSTRALAVELGVSRNTTTLAYELLLLEGYLESHVGQGTEVTRRLPSSLSPENTDSTRKKQPVAPNPPPVRLASRVRPLQEIGYPERVEQGVPGAFRGGEPALDLFPYELWARLVARSARQSLRHHAHYQSPAGYYPLREAIASHIGITRGVRCAPEQIIVTAGSQGALDMAVRTLLNPGEAAWIENPGYFGAQGALLASGARLVPVPVDEQGLVVEVGQRLCPEARMVATTPSHQFPTAVTMSMGRRLALLDWAMQAGAWILEDDYDSEYRFSGRPLEALQGLDRAGRVLYIGSFSKTLFPALRLGYLIVPAELVEPMLATRRFIDVQAPLLEQIALAGFMREGHFARHLRRMRQHYSKRRDLLHRELLHHLGHLLEVHAPEAGMHLVGWLPPGKDDRRAAGLAARAGIEVAPISGYSVGREPLPRGGLLFGYANTNEQNIVLGVKKLAAALEQL